MKIESMDQLKSIIAETAAAVIEEKIQVLLKPQGKYLDGHAPAYVPNIRQDQASEEIKGLGFIRAVRAQYFQKTRGMGLIEAAKFCYPKDFKLHNALDVTINKAQQSETVGSEGGYWVYPDYQQQIIELLGAATVLRKAGATVIPMPRGTTTYTEVTSGATFSWVGENQVTTPTSIGVGELNFSAKDLQGIIPISNNLLMDADVDVEKQILAQVIRDYARAEDAAFIRGIGSSNSPKGIRYAVNQTTNYLITKGATAALMADDLAQAQLALTGANVEAVKPIWIANPRTEGAIFNKMNSNAQYIWQPEMASQGTLLRGKMYTTTAVPINLSGTLSELYYGDAAKCVIADTKQMTSELIPNAAYDNGSGTVISGLSKNQSVLKVTGRLDFGLLYEVGFACIYNVAY